MKANTHEFKEIYSTFVLKKTVETISFDRRKRIESEPNAKRAEESVGGCFEESLKAPATKINFKISEP
ncbi:hypothetical protein CWI38_1760p0010 [Hamiltosporidium tvaerminnensis]|uniref:Uncharacterized protein n=1 Tax=Hamiltosporidium tvaerminnensis TaxID=1176355 RepID=A0A4Q9LQF3_9MICR|nr:hypothetical protein CWI38_1760p0010 [Hamiltosporidium tvaerminnensis]